ncbi:unnamed protein product [Ectocarpus sp. 6 AP-2014]
MKMARGESSLRMPKEATCDVECAMKVEEIRIMSKKRKQSQRVGGNGALASEEGANISAKAAKRPLSNSNGCGAGTQSAKSGGGGGGGGSVPPPADQISAASAGVAAPNLSKASSASAAGGGGSGGGGKDSKHAASRRRFVWSVPLHQDFVAAVFDVGLKCASPKLLLEMMPVVDGLTSEHIKSHLQKYRLHRQRSREEFLKSYNYLTDLDGGKSLGGGSAAATVAKAAAAAAGGGGGDDVKDFSPGRGRDAETPECGSSCDCVDTSKLSGGSGFGGGSSSLAEADGRGEAARSKSTTGFAQAASGDEGAEGSGGGAKASAQLAGGGTEAVGGAQRLQLPGEAAAGEVVNGALLLSHLELLAKGIDMQVKFHNHLREVVESQQQLQAQLVRQQGREHVPQHPAEFSGGSGGGRMPRAFPSSAAGTTTATAASAVGFCPPSDLQYAGSIVGAEGNNRVPKEVHLVGGGCGSGVSTAGYSSNLSDSSSLVWSGGGEDKLAGSPKEAEQGGRGAAAAERPRRRERPGVLNHAGASQLEGAAAADVSMDSARAAASKARPSVADHIRGDGTGEHLGDGQQQQQFDPAAMREAFSVQAGAGRVVAPSHSQGLSGRQGAGLAAPRGYMAGDYTLTPKAPEDGGAGRLAPHARGQPAVLGAELLAGEGALGAHKSIFAARSPAEARVALASATLAPVTSTGNASNGQETLTLQRHMQAQMSMQQSMLSACNDQATNFGQRGWCGGGGPPAAAAAAVATPAFGEAGGGALRGGSGAGKEGGGNGDGAGADLGNSKEQQRLDSLSLQPSDAGDPSAMMGLLPQDDMFDFGMLDREGELKSALGDSTPPGPPVARPNGDEHSTLFSFLME